MCFLKKYQDEVRKDYKIKLADLEAKTLNLGKYKAELHMQQQH